MKTTIDSGIQKSLEDAEIDIEIKKTAADVLALKQAAEKE